MGTGAHWTGGEWLVVEADESDGTHLELPLYGTILTNVEADHLDHYGTFDAIVASFDRYLAQIAGPEGAVRRRPGRAPTSRPPRRDHLRHVGDGADYRGRRRAAPSRARSRSPSSAGRRAPRRQVDACRCAACTTSSTPPARSAMALAARRRRSTRCRDALATFGGVARRFDIRGVDGGATFVDDYAHLPTRDRRRPRRGPRQRRRLAAGGRRVPAQPLQPHGRDVARLRATRSSTPTSSCSPTSTRRARRRSPASPASSSSTPCSTRTRRAGGVAAAAGRPRRLPRRRGCARRRLHLDGLRRHRHAARRGADAAPPAERPGRRSSRIATDAVAAAAAILGAAGADRDVPLAPLTTYRVGARRRCSSRRVGSTTCAPSPRSSRVRPAGARRRAAAPTCSSPTPGSTGSPCRSPTSPADRRSTSRRRRRRHRRRRRAAAGARPAHRGRGAHRVRVGGRCAGIDRRCGADERRRTRIRHGCLRSSTSTCSTWTHAAPR